MAWESWSAFWSMGGRGVFVWSAFGVTAVCIAVEVAVLRRAARRSRQRLARLQQWDLSAQEARP